VGPVFAESHEPGTDRRAYIRFLSRLFTNPGPDTIEVIFGGLKALRERVFEVLCKSLPHVPRKELAWRYLFLSGSVHFTTAQIGYVEIISKGQCASDNLGEALAHLITAQAAMLSAPATSATERALARRHFKRPSAPSSQAVAPKSSRKTRERAMDSNLN
jgi:hypothetical protein